MPFIGIQMSGSILSQKRRARQKLGTTCRVETKHPKKSRFTHYSSRFMTFLGHIASPMSRDATQLCPKEPFSMALGRGGRGWYQVEGLREQRGLKWVGKW